MATDPPALAMNVKDRDPGDSMNGDIPYKDALDFDIKTLARETGQNVLDANGMMDGPAKIVYRFLRLEGTDLDEFKDAVDWEDYAAHLARFRDEDTSLRIDDFLADLEEREQLDVLVVEDHNTHGLFGGEIEDGTPYNALVRDSKITVKDDDTSGGSHGVGKFVNYGLSLGSMVLFYSDLPGDLLDMDEVGAADLDEQVANGPRLVGRALLPDYRRTDKRILDGEEIWFGTYDASAETDRPVSMWRTEAESTAERLGLARPDTPGTSVGIVGFGRPDGDVPPDIEEAADELKHALAYHFWPAMEMGDLEVAVETPESAREAVTVDKAMNDFAPEIAPFVQIFRQYQDADQELGEPGDVAKTILSFEFEPKDESPVDGTVNLGVRVPTAADLEHTDTLNHVAIFRGRGMVVDYLRKRSLASRGKDFHAILAAGNARPWPDGTPTDVDAAVDKFLRAAEPAEHDEWDNQPKLQQNYKGRCAGVVRDIQGDYLTDAILPLIRTSDDDEGDMVPSVSALFDLGSQGTGGGDDDGVVQRTVLSREFDESDRRWTYEVEVSPKDDVHGDWDAELTLRRKGDDNSKAGDIDVEGLELVKPTPGASVDTELKGRSNKPDLKVATITAAASVSEVVVRLTSVQLPSTDARLGDIGALTLGVTGNVVEAEAESASADGGD